MIKKYNWHVNVSALNIFLIRFILIGNGLIGESLKRLGGAIING